MFPIKKFTQFFSLLASSKKFTAMPQLPKENKEKQIFFEVNTASGKNKQTKELSHQF
jgi:hypothetical protein